MSNSMGQSKFEVFLINTREELKALRRKNRERTLRIINTYAPIIISGAKRYADIINSVYGDYGNIIITILYLLSVVFLDNTLFYTFIWIVCIILNLIGGYIKIQKDKFYLTQDYSKILEEVDKLISDCLTEYAIFDGYDGTRYINAKEEEKIKENISTMVSARISQSLLDRLAIAYNPDSVYTLIAARISIIILSYVVENNRSKNKEQTIPNINTTTSTIPYILQPRDNS